MTKLELTGEEREALLRVIEEAVRDPRYPLSPEIEALKRIADKLREHRAPRR